MLTFAETNSKALAMSEGNYSLKEMRTISSLLSESRKFIAVGRKLLSERDENVCKPICIVTIVFPLSEGNYSLKEMRTWRC